MTKFRYFEAPEADMHALVPGVRRCGICGKEGRCFDLQQAVRDSSITASEGCIACLQAGMFGFSHITEAGDLEEGGLTWYDDDEPEGPARVFVVDSSGSADPVPAQAAPPPRVTVPAEAVEVLRRTPDFPTWNEVAWPVHCSDFMVYQGTWEPPDVRAAAVRRHQEPAELFAEMTGGSHDRLWSDEAERWAFAFHVFRCRACNTIRGAVDLD